MVVTRKCYYTGKRENYISKDKRDASNNISCREVSKGILNWDRYQDVFFLQ